MAQYGAANVMLDATSESERPTSKWRMQRRHMVAVLAFLGFANIYAMRANLSVAIVKMTSNTTVNNDGNTLIKKAEFPDWNSVVQGAILGSFFYGYILTQLLGGHMAYRFGGKFIYFIGVFGTAVFTLLSPPLAKMGKSFLMGARFMEGLCEGVTYPAMHAILSNWVPTLEKTKISAFAYAGAYFGTVITMPISALLGHYFGWPSIFYFFGLVALLWCYFWIKLFYNLPENDPKITIDELTLLKREARHSIPEHVPWRQIFTSKSVWAIVIAHFCQNWGFYTMLTSLPRILETLLHYDHETAASLSALPYLLMGIILLSGGGCADYFRERRLWPTVKARKVFCCLGFIGEALFLMIATTGIWDKLVLCSIILSVGFGGLTWSAFSANSLDIAPQYAGHLMGISNTLATLPGMLCPLFVGAVVKEQVPSEWSIVFTVTSAIYLFGAFAFALWAKGEKESWASNQVAYVETAD